MRRSAGRPDASSSSKPVRSSAAASSTQAAIRTSARTLRRTAIEPHRRPASGHGRRAHRTCRPCGRRHLADGIVRRGQVDARDGPRARALRPRMGRVHDRRRQRAPRAQRGPGLLARGPAGEHPPCRRGRRTVRRRRARLHHGLHLPLRRRSPAGARHRRRAGGSSRSTSAPNSRSAKPATRRVSTAGHAPAKSRG